MDGHRPITKPTTRMSMAFLAMIIGITGFIAFGNLVDDRYGITSWQGAAMFAFGAIFLIAVHKAQHLIPLVRRLTRRPR